MAVQQSLVIRRRFKSLHLIVGAAVPVTDGQRIIGTDNAHFQVVAHLPEPQLIRGDVRQKPGDIGIARRRVIVDDRVMAVATAKQIGVIASPTIKQIVTSATVENIIAGAAEQCVVAGATSEDVITIPSVQGAALRQLQCVIAIGTVDTVNAKPLNLIRGPDRAIGELDLFNPVVSVGVMVGHGNRVVLAITDDQVVPDTLKSNLVRQHVGEFDRVNIASSGIVVGNRVLAVSFREDVGIVAGSTFEAVIAFAADQGVVAGTAVEGIVAITAVKYIITATTGKKLFAELGISSDQEMNKGNLDHGLAGSGQKFIVFAEPPAMVEPGETTLDDPTFWQNLEDMSLGALDHNQQATEHGPPPIKQLASVSAIKKHSL